MSAPWRIERRGKGHWVILQWDNQKGYVSKGSGIRGIDCIKAFVKGEMTVSLSDCLAASLWDFQVLDPGPSTVKVTEEDEVDEATIREGYWHI